LMSCRKGIGIGSICRSELTQCLDRPTMELRQWRVAGGVVTNLKRDQPVL